MPKWDALLRQDSCFNKTLPYKLLFISLQTQTKAETDGFIKWDEAETIKCESWMTNMVGKRHSTYFM